MIKAEDVEKIIDEQENIKLNYKKRTIEAIVEIVEKDMLREIKKSKLKNNYIFNIILTDLWPCGEDYVQVAITRNIDELNDASKLLEEKLKSSGWKNIKIKISNLWWPMAPRFKIWVER